MSTTTKSESNKTELESGSRATSVIAPQTGLETEKKARKSKKWKNAHRLEKGMTKAARRLSKAISEGVDVWVEKRDKSAGKKKDGSLKDMSKNVGKALRKTLKQASKAPSDLVDAVSKLSTNQLRPGKTLFR